MGHKALVANAQSVAQIVVWVTEDALVVCVLIETEGNVWKHLFHCAGIVYQSVVLVAGFASVVWIVGHTIENEVGIQNTDILEGCFVA